ncbi:MAG: IMP dehydrogenase [Ignavibacteria bacterium]
MCSTSVKSGIGIGQVDAIIRALEARENLKSDVKIIADGGINTPGAMCKALALGCDAVMFGRVLAGTEESPEMYLNIIHRDGRNTAAALRLL